MFNQKIRAVIQIIRPELAFAAGVSVVLGEIIALGKFAGLRETILGFVCGFFLSGSAIILNDYFDLEVDRVNAPERPLPMGLVSAGEAIFLAIATICLGLAASFLIGPVAFIVCVIMALIGFLYNWKFKQAGLTGNLMVASSVAITFILGGIASGQPWNKIVWTFALIAFLFDLGEEIAGDAMDMEGDARRGSRSIAILRGRRFALVLSSFLFGLVVLISFIPLLLGWLGLIYLVMIVITDGIIVVYATRLLNSKTPAEGRGAMRRIYLGALVAMLAFILGKLIA